MLHYDRIFVSEGINVNKANGSRKCIVFNYYFIIFSNGCHYLMQKAIIFNDVGIVFYNFFHYKKWIIKKLVTEWNIRRLQKKARNCSHQESGKEKAKDYYKNNRKRLLCYNKNLWEEATL